MQQPPISGTPFAFIAPGAPNFEAQGIAYAWDQMRAFGGQHLRDGLVTLEQLKVQVINQ